jgi:hypothetical protein
MFCNMSNLVGSFTIWNAERFKQMLDYAKLGERFRTSIHAFEIINKSKGNV